MQKTAGSASQTSTLAVRTKNLLKAIAKNKYLYLLLLPGLIYFIIFKYGPMYGVIIAFKDYNMIKGITGSEWVGFEHFERLFRTNTFAEVFRNTFIISLLKLLFGFPAPIILALLLNEVGNKYFKRISQSIMYLPHFISWVIFAGIIMAFLNPVDGVITPSFCLG